MVNFFQVAEGVNTDSLLSEVLAHPELWNRNPARLSNLGPHHETQDIPLRYKDETENIISGDWSRFSDPHIPEWYQAIQYLPSAKPLIFDLMHAVNGEMLGGCIIYKVEPHKQIYPHTDKGWHPDFYDKYNICLSSNSNAAFCYNGQRLEQKKGDVHFFINTVPHWVVNEGACDHIVLTVCIRRDRGYRVPFAPDGWAIDKSRGM